VKIVSYSFRRRSREHTRQALPPEKSSRYLLKIGGIAMFIAAYSKALPKKGPHAFE